VQHDQDGSIDGTMAYVYSDSALRPQEFLNRLQMKQRIALQHAADTVTLTGGFIAALNATADAYGEADRYSVSPDKSSIAPARNS